MNHLPPCFSTGRRPTIITGRYRMAGEANIRKAMERTRLRKPSRSQDLRMRVQLIRSSLLRKELQLGHLRALLIEPVDGHAGGVTGRNRNVRFLSLPFHAINAEI